MKSFEWILIYLSIGLFFDSCNEPYIIEVPKSEPKLVAHVVANTTNDKYADEGYRWHLSLSMSYGILENYFDADCESWRPSITISDGINSNISEQGPSNDCLVSIVDSFKTIELQSGTKYNLVAKDNIHSTITSEYYHPFPVPVFLKNLKLFGKGIYDTGSTYQLFGKYYDLDIEINDPNYNNYYQLEVVHRVEYENGWGEYAFKYEMAEINTFGYNQGQFFNDQEFNGQKKEIKLNMFLEDNNEEERLGRIITGQFLVIKLRNFSPKLFEFYHDYYLQSLSEQDPNGSPMPISSNIEGGFGVFGGYAENQQTISVDLLNN